jgi:histidyl-tRNA synthetase
VISGELRRAGIRTDMAYGGRALKSAMKAADGSGARVALVLGDREIEAGSIVVKDLLGGEQSSVPVADVVPAVRSLLGAGRKERV